MSVTVGDHRSPGGTDHEPDSISDLLQCVIDELQLPPGDIEVTLVDDAQIAVLNREYRQKNSPTNVLSFPHYQWDSPGVCQLPLATLEQVDRPVLWGEIIVSCETVKRDAENTATVYFEELIRMCIHGLLHLFGYDHQTDDQFEEMEAIEKKGMEFALRRLEQKNYE